jgi:hypothetical protein
VVVRTARVCEAATKAIAASNTTAAATVDVTYSTGARNAVAARAAIFLIEVVICIAKIMATV